MPIPLPFVWVTLMNGLTVNMVLRMRIFQQVRDGARLAQGITRVELVHELPLSLSHLLLLRRVLLHLLCPHRLHRQHDVHGGKPRGAVGSNRLLRARVDRCLVDDRHSLREGPNHFRHAQNV